MAADLVPMRWPKAWKDPAALALLQGSGINYLLVDQSAELSGVREKAKQAGLQVGAADAVPSPITMVQGMWPGIRLSRAGGDQAVSGPTGNPWVDSNEALIRLTSATNVGTRVWVNAIPKGPQTAPDAYVIGVLDAAAHGGRWVISLDDKLASELAAKQPAALETWKKIAQATAFFSQHQKWSEYGPAAVVGVVSDFTGKDAAFSKELVNLLARTGQQYRVIPQDQLNASSLQGLKALLYADRQQLAPDALKTVLAFVQQGALLVAGPQWGQLPGASGMQDKHPRFAIHSVGKGRIAVAQAVPTDPYVFASDAAVLVSHRYDLLRFWNGGAIGSRYAVAPDGKRATVQMVFYAQRPAELTSVRVAGRYRTAKLITLDHPEPRPVTMELQKDSIELHLPQVSRYAALELEA